MIDDSSQWKAFDPMADTPTTYTFESEVAELITAMIAAGKPVEVVVDGERYTLELTAPGRKKPDAEYDGMDVRTSETVGGVTTSYIAASTISICFPLRSRHDYGSVACSP